MSSSSNIHPSAIINPKAKIGNGVKIGPFSIIGPNVVIGDNTEIFSHVVIEGNTTIGTDCKIYPFCSIGHPPQDLKFKGEDSRIEIGNNNVIREYTTIQPGTEGGGMLTKVGDNNLFMIGIHIAHDCIVGSNCIFANHATLAGHVVIEDFVVLGGLVGVHQYVRVGTHAMVGTITAVVEDVIPFGTVVGERGTLESLNLRGMKRRGFDKDEINLANQAFKELFNEESGELFAQRLAKVEKKYQDISTVKTIIDFLKSDSSRAICKPKRKA